MISSEAPVVGHVAGTFRYPVKSMAGESPDGVELSWHGVAGDRRWAFVRPGQEANGFPWQTIREQPRMWRFTARLREPDRPNRSAVDVATPDGSVLAVTDPGLPDLIGTGLGLMRLHRGLFDSMPLSLISTATVADLCRDIGIEPDPRRFRPNLLVETVTPYVEDGWVSRTLRIGDAVVRCDRRDPRCVIINVDPDSARTDPAMLRVVAAERQSCAGVYASVVQPGRVAVGDEIRLIGQAEEGRS